MHISQIKCKKLINQISTASYGQNKRGAQYIGSNLPNWQWNLPRDIAWLVSNSQVSQCLRCGSSGFISLSQTTEAGNPGGCKAIIYLAKHFLESTVVKLDYSNLSTALIGGTWWRQLRTGCLRCMPIGLWHMHGHLSILHHGSHTVRSKEETRWAHCCSATQFICCSHSWKWS